MHNEMQIVSEVLEKVFVVVGYVTEEPVWSGLQGPTSAELSEIDRNDFTKQFTQHATSNSLTEQV